jgi:5-methylcytosine-specific restriction endonuclease McrA
MAKQGNWLRAEKRVALYERDGWQCVYCGRGPRTQQPLRLTGVVLSLDHLIPQSQNGSNHETNLVTACISCNSSRQDKAWTEYATGGAIERIEYLIQQPLDIAQGKAIIASLKGNAEVEIR